MNAEEVKNLSAFRKYGNGLLQHIIVKKIIKEFLLILSFKLMMDICVFLAISHDSSKMLYLGRFFCVALLIH